MLKEVRTSSLILSDKDEISEIQKVIKVGPWVKDAFGEGDWVKINFSRFCRPKANKSLKDGNDFDSTSIEFHIPVVEFGGDPFLLIDQGDVEYWWSKDEYNG